MPKDFQKSKIRTQQAEFMSWLKAILNDDTRRAMLRVWLDQHEMPVIEMKQRGSTRRIAELLATKQNQKL